MTAGEESEITGRRPDWSPASHEVGGVVGGGSRGVERTKEYARLRGSCPVAWTEDWGGYWTISRYADVRDAATKHQVFRSGQLFVQVPQPFPVIPISLNPPEHATYRRALNKYFALKPMAELEPTIRAHVAQRLSLLLERGSADMVPEFCAPVSAQGLALLLNMPDSAWQEFLGQSEALEELRRDEEDAAAIGERSYAILAQYVSQLVQERQEHPLDPDKDLISGILSMSVEGAPIDAEMVIGIGVMLFGAGHGTTRDGLAGSLYLLATNPVDQDRLRTDPSLIPSAIEEFLRLDPPVHESGRRAAQLVELHDRTIQEGELISLSLAAANRDEREFPSPEDCIIEREPNRHLSFGHGVHKCVGAPLGRLEIRVALEEILAATSAFELNGDAEPNTAIFLGGISSLPLRFTRR